MDVLTRITELREKRGWTIWKLGEESGVDQSTISAWYKKGRSPSVSSLEKICYSFGITMSQFFLANESSTDLTGEQRDLLESWCALSKKQREIVLLLIKNIPAQDDR